MDKYISWPRLLGMQVEPQQAGVEERHYLQLCGGLGARLRRREIYVG